MKLVIDEKYEVIANWQNESLTVKESKGKKISVLWTIHFDKRTNVKGENMSLTLTSTQKVSLAVNYVDARGNVAQVEGVPTWTVSDPTVLTVVTNEENPFEVVAFAAGPVGNAQVVVTADADLGEGVEEVTGVLDVTVVAGKATGVSIAAGVPEEQEL